MRLVGAMGTTSFHTLTPSRVHCPGQTPLGDASTCTKRFAARRDSHTTESPSSLWDPNLGSVRCSPKQPTNNTLGAIVGTLASLTSGRARRDPNSLLRRGVTSTMLVGVTGLHLSAIHS